MAARKRSKATLRQSGKKRAARSAPAGASRRTVTKQLSSRSSVTTGVRVKKAVKKTVAGETVAGETAAKKRTTTKPTSKANAAPRPAATKRAPPAAKLDARAGAPAVGQKAPSFVLLDGAGGRISSADLAGQPYVIYFYPKDDTPGCTVEACGFRDAAERFEGLGVRVLGVSPDSVASHQRFGQKHGLNFTLLSDPDHELANAYGVWSLKKNYGREYMGIVRSTFLVDAAGTIRAVWTGVRVKGHVDQVCAAAHELS